jgi:hypothetical protein
VPAIVAAIVAVKTAVTDGAVRSQVNKNKAEAGYQLTRQAVEALEARQAELEQEVRTLRAHQSAMSPNRLHPPTRPPPPPQEPSSPTRLPSDLDKAERKVYGAQPAPVIESLPAASP